MTRQETVTNIRNSVLSIPLSTIQAELGKKFYGMNKVIEALYIGISTGKNIILYGPGGFGKTQIVKAFLEFVNVPAPTVIGYEDMEVDALLGIPNIQKLTEESVYEVAFEKSVFNNPGILILEEFLDARPSTAAALKDILTEGGLRQGNKLIESLISSVVICTNKSPDDVSIDDSTTAFYKERFPIRMKVVWNSYTHEDYHNFLKVIKPDKLVEQPLLYDVLAEIASRTTSLVSPRVVKDASDLLDVHKNIQVLQYVDGLETVDMTEVMVYCSFVTERIKVHSILARAEVWYDGIYSAPLTTVRMITNALAEIDFVVKRMATLTSKHQENITEILQFISKCNQLEVTLRNRIVGELSKQSETELTALFDDTSSQ